MPENGFAVIADLYNRIFVNACSNPDLTVDYAVWNRIFEGLPQDYLLPDMQVYALLPPK